MPVAAQVARQLPYEVAVTVKLDDEAGAAGLVFHADGGDKHYGFYPTGGKLRLTRFDGPDVFSWKILDQRPARTTGPANGTRSRSASRRTRSSATSTTSWCIESTDAGLTEGKVGLAKFRDTQAEFKQFQVGQDDCRSAAPPELADARHEGGRRACPAEGTAKADLVEKLPPDGPPATGVLRERAQQLEQQAAQLRQLAQAVHQQRASGRAGEGLDGQGGRRSTCSTPALLIARLDNEELDVEAYRSEVERMAREIAGRAAEGRRRSGEADGAEQVPVHASTASTAAAATTTTAPTAISTR